MQNKFYKVTTGEFIKRVSDAVSDREVAINSLVKLQEDIGASSVSEYSSGGVAFFNFKERPDKKVWKQVCDGYMPKLSSKEGKLISKRISEIPKLNNIQECLDVFNLKGVRVLGEGTSRGVRVHSPSFCGKHDLGIYFIKVPQSEENPYIPTSKDMIECKEWEMMKFMDK